MKNVIQRNGVVLPKEQEPVVHSLFLVMQTWRETLESLPTPQNMLVDLREHKVGFVFSFSFLFSLFSFLFSRFFSLFSFLFSLESLCLV